MGFGQISSGLPFLRMPTQRIRQHSALVFQSKNHISVKNKCVRYLMAQSGYAVRRENANIQFMADISNLFHPSMTKMWYGFAVESGFMPDGMEGIVSQNVSA